MAIRITVINQSRGTTIKVDGRLQAVDIDDLMRELSQAGDLVAIDLSDLSSSDRESARFLRGLIAKGVVLHAATPYVRHGRGHRCRLKTCPLGSVRCRKLVEHSG